jgi:hypothetical protein
MVKIKRGIQVLVLAALVSVNWQLSARADACQENGPEWCCENIACPQNEGYCMVDGGELDGDCGWDEGEERCDVPMCIRID